MRRIACRLEYCPADRVVARLLKILGPKRLRAFQRAFGGDRIWIPKKGVRLPCSACLFRGQCVRIWRREGHQAGTIARHLGVSVKTVYRVLEKRGRRYSRLRRKRE